MKKRPSELLSNNLYQQLPDDDSILNINYHTRRLLLIALNKFKKPHQCAEVLGISERTVFRMKVEFGIIQQDKKYFIIINRKFYASCGLEDESLCKNSLA